MKIGIIGGSGLDNPEFLKDYEEKEVDTVYGKPSSRISCGKLDGVEVCILSRHGKNHEIYPSKVNFRANISALKQLGCEIIIGTSAVGSLKDSIRPGDLVFPDQFIDFTKKRESTFFDEYGNVQHCQMAEPFDRELRKILIDCCRNLGFDFHEKANILVIEGPRFSTKAESNLFRGFADIIGMTTVPEVVLANELGIKYATIAMSTDYDCWKEGEEPVSFEMVMQRMKENAEKVKQLLLRAVSRIARREEDFIKSKITNIPNWPKQGIVFRDITSLLSDREGMKRVTDIFVNRYKNKRIDVIAGIEARGFIIGGILADKLGAGFVPIRKSGKLPRETLKEEYELEYGKDNIEIHRDAIKPGDRVLLIDDLIATGGTALAGCNLIEKLGGIIEEVAFVIELPDLKGREKLKKWEVFSVVSFEGE
jgi:5'-methylthioadenosine phosphorylase